MKIAVLAIVLCVAIAAAAPLSEKAKKLKEEMDKCMRDNGVTEAEFSAMAKSKPNVDQVKDNLKCSIKCFMQSNGFLDNAGNFNTKEVKKQIKGVPDQAAAKAVVEKCASVKGSTDCDTAYMIMKCMDEYHGQY